MVRLADRVNSIPITAADLEVLQKTGGYSVDAVESPIITYDIPIHAQGVTDRWLRTFDNIEGVANWGGATAICEDTELKLLNMSPTTTGSWRLEFRNNGYMRVNRFNDDIDALAQDRMREAIREWEQSLPDCLLQHPLASETSERVVQVFVIQDNNKELDNFFDSFEDTGAIE